MPYKLFKERQQYAKEYYNVNKIRIKRRAQQWYLDHTLRHRTTGDQWREAHFASQLYSRAKASAKARRLRFAIVVADIIIPEYCPYLNIKLTTFVNGGRQDSNASLDRIDNSKGYLPGNIQVISSKANFMKRNATIRELKTFATNILLIH